MLYFTKSKIFLYFCLSFILGIAIASFYVISGLILLIFLIISIISISVFWNNKKAMALAVCLIFLSGGIYRYQLDINPPKRDNLFSSRGDYDGQSEAFNIIGGNGQTAVFKGIIVSLPERKTSSVYYEVRPNDLKLGAEAVDYKDKILVTLPLSEKEYGYGDFLEFRGKIRFPPDNEKFSYRKYLANKKIYFLMNYPEASILAEDVFCKSEANGKNLTDGYGKLECQTHKISAALLDLRYRMIGVINKSMPEPESSLSSAILFGNDKAVPNDLLDKFNSTGTRHIMAVSGQNITILTLILVNLALALGGSRRIAFYFAFISIIFYIVLIGMPASAVRAGVMGSLVLIAERIGRLNVSYRALVFAAAGMLILNPALLVFDAGFQLSFAATAGIIFIYPILLEYLGKIPNILEIRSSLAMTLAALATTLPVSILSFNQFSLISPLANILIAPLMPIAMIFGFIIIIIGAILPFLSQVVGWFVWLILAYEIKTVEFLSAFSFSLLKSIEVSKWYMLAYYLFLGLVLLKIKKRKAEEIILSNETDKKPE